MPMASHSSQISSVLARAAGGQEWVQSSKQKFPAGVVVEEAMDVVRVLEGFLVRQERGLVARRHLHRLQQFASGLVELATVGAAQRKQQRWKMW